MGIWTQNRQCEAGMEGGGLTKEKKGQRNSEMDTVDG